MVLRRALFIMDTRKRSWVKSITWRIAGIFILGAISYGATRNWSETTMITAAFHIIRLILYYFHERLWEVVAWGRVRHPLAHLAMRENLTAEDYRMIEQILAKHKYLAEAPEYEI